MKENVVLISQPRSGSTALFDCLQQPWHPYISGQKSEFLDCTDTFFPAHKQTGNLIWDDEVDNYYWNKDYYNLKKYYQSKIFSNCVYYKPILQNGIIKIFSDNWNNELIDDNCIYLEQQRRIDILKQSSPWTIKVLDYQIDNFNWVDRSNTTVIVLLRDAMEKIASHARQLNTGIWHTVTNSHDIEINKKIDMNEVRGYVDSHNKFFKTIEDLNPDCVVTYSWLTSRKIFKNSKYKKINTQDAAAFFNDYTEASDYISETATTPFLLNQNLIDKFIK